MTQESFMLCGIAPTSSLRRGEVMCEKKSSCKSCPSGMGSPLEKRRPARTAHGAEAEVVEATTLPLREVFRLHGHQQDCSTSATELAAKLIEAESLALRLEYRLRAILGHAAVRKLIVITRPQLYLTTPSGGCLGVTNFLQLMRSEIIGSGSQTECDCQCQSRTTEDILLDTHARRTQPSDQDKK